MSAPIPNQRARWRRWAGAGLGLLGAVVLVGGAVLSVQALSGWPQLDGQLRLSVLTAPVDVRRDGSDVTHIRATHRLDAYRALGAVHAQERGWQLELNRRVMHGRLSEVLGPAALPTDRLLLTLGIRKAAQAQYARLPEHAQQVLQAYADGVNAFIASDHHQPGPEFRLLGLDPKPAARQGQFWHPSDSMGWALMMALDLGGNWGHELARLTALQVLDTQRLWELMPAYPGEAPATRTDLAALYRGLGVFQLTPGTTAARAPGGAHFGIQPNNAPAGLAADWVAWANQVGDVQGRGSNNWVVSGQRTESGLPLLANDPHLGLSAPAIWYFARLSAPADSAAEPDPAARPLDVMGATLPGLPLVVLGRNRSVAWGFTNTGPDVQDLYLEQLNPDNPDQYRVPSDSAEPHWSDFQVWDERIPVKGQGDVVHRVRHSRHGPVLTDAQPQHARVINTRRYVLSLRWSALDADNHTILAGLEGADAQSVPELIRAYRHYHSPMQNVVMADVHGQVAYKAAGRVPLRAEQNDIRGVAPSPGWESRYDWVGWLPYEQTPEARLPGPATTPQSPALGLDSGVAQVLGAEQGWLATANQRIHGPDFGAFLTQDWSTPDRQDRIQQRLAERDRHTVDTMAAIQGDVVSLATQRLLPMLRTAQPRHPLGARAMAVLNGFDGTMDADAPAPLIVSAWIDALTRMTVGERLGDDTFKALYGKRQFREALEALLLRNDPFWCGPSGCQAVLGRALDQALTDLVSVHGPELEHWRWGHAHVAMSKHQPFSQVPLLARWVEVRVPTGGDAYTVNVGRYQFEDPKWPFANRHAASLRAIYDLANLDNSRFIYQTGQSGNPFDPRYRDMAAEWATLRYRPLQMDSAVFKHHLHLTP